MIREGISIKGQTAWILVFSILIASIGLNVSSTAVVIGAMLISPLMGPILGIGFSIGVNDVDTLKGSVINFGAMVFLSLLTSFLFFSIPLFKEATPEILARTTPDVRDVLIAISARTRGCHFEGQPFGAAGLLGLASSVRYGPGRTHGDPR